MKLLKMGILLVLLLSITACSTKEYAYPLHFETLLKDRSILAFDITIHMKSSDGLEEFRKKVKQVQYGLRLILVQRYPDQVSTPKRVKSVIRKLCKSQMQHPVKSVEIKAFKLKRYMGLSGYIDDESEKSVNRKGLTGQ